MPVTPLTDEERAALTAHTARVEQRRQAHMAEMRGYSLEWKADGVRHLTHGPPLWPRITTRKDEA